MPSNQSWRDQIEAKQRLLDPVVQRAIDRVRLAVATRSPNITSSFFYGAIGIDPKHLAIWYIFAADAQKLLAKANGLAGDLDRMSRNALREEGYPPPAIALISVSFASDAEINQAGGWRAFFA